MQEKTYKSSTIILIVAIVLIAAIGVYVSRTHVSKIKADPGGLPLVYQNDAKGFSIRYPKDFTIDEGYVNQSRGPGKDIGGVKFTIASDLAKGTNLGSDSYLSVEQIPNAGESCSADKFLDLSKGDNFTTVVDAGVDYSLATTTGAGAGNRYEEAVFALPNSNPCTAVHYLTHYSVIENYPKGTVKEFDKVALKGIFDEMRRTLTVYKPTVK
jgi:hypothetical protein